MVGTAPTAKSASLLIKPSFFFYASYTFPFYQHTRVMRTPYFLGRHQTTSTTPHAADVKPKVTQCAMRANPDSIVHVGRVACKYPTRHALVTKRTLRAFACLYPVTVTGAPVVAARLAVDAALVHRDGLLAHFCAGEEAETRLAGAAPRPVQRRQHLGLAVASRQELRAPLEKRLDVGRGVEEMDVVRLVRLATQALAALVRFNATKHFARPSVSVDVCERRGGRRGG